MYVSEIVGPRRRGIPIVWWKDKVKEYMHERGADRGRGIELARRECVDRERWRVSCCGYSLGDVSGGNKASEIIDRWMVNINAMIKVLDNKTLVPNFSRYNFENLRRPVLHVHLPDTTKVKIQWFYFRNQLLTQQYNFILYCGLRPNN